MEGLTQWSVDLCPTSFRDEVAATLNALLTPYQERN